MGEVPYRGEAHISFELDTRPVAPRVIEGVIPIPIQVIRNKDKYLFGDLRLWEGKSCGEAFLREAFFAEAGRVALELGELGRQLTEDWRRIWPEDVWWGQMWWDGENERGREAWVNAFLKEGEMEPDLNKARFVNPILRFFTYEHLPEDLKELSRSVSELAHRMDALLPECPEKSAGMRKLLEAKDCFVRAKL